MDVYGELYPSVKGSMRKSPMIIFLNVREKYQKISIADQKWKLTFEQGCSIWKRSQKTESQKMKDLMVSED